MSTYPPRVSKHITLYIVLYHILHLLPPPPHPPSPTKIILKFPAIVSTTKLKIYYGHLIENSPRLMQLPSQQSLNMYNKICRL